MAGIPKIRFKGFTRMGGISNLNDRLARKEKKYLDRNQQLDLVIVVDRLLTGFEDRKSVV